MQLPIPTDLWTALKQAGLLTSGSRYSSVVYEDSFPDSLSTHDRLTQI